MTAAERGWRVVETDGIVPPARVSDVSRWEDDHWTFDHPNRDTIPSNRRIVWNIKLADGSRLTGRKHRRLLSAVKLFTWSMRIAPPNGRLPQKWSTLMKTGDYALMLVKWMTSNGINRFRDLSEDDIASYMATVRRRKGRGGKCINSYTAGCIARVVEDIYFQRGMLPDAIMVPPFRKGEGPQELMRARVITPTDRLPDEFARELFTASEDWIRKGESIVKFYNLFQSRLRSVKTRKTFAHLRVKRNRRHFEGRAAWHSAYSHRPCLDALPVGCPEIDNPRALARALDYCVCACFTVIAMLTGVRISEALSIQENCVSKETHKISGRKYSYLVSRQHKVRGSDSGVLMKWIAPDLVVDALRLLRAATKTLREDTGFAELFLSRHGLTGDIFPIEKRDFDRRLNRYADVACSHKNGWKLKCHQFRRTFARFVARRDHTGLLALSTHLKHISLAMTDEGYVGNDFSLDELIDEEIEATVFAALQAVASGERIGGSMGQRISKRLDFLGRAGSQQRADFQRFILQETSLILVPDIFGDCVFAPEDALCEGEERRRGLGTCMDCSNLLIRQEHRAFWEEYVIRCERLIRDASSTLQIAPIRSRLKRAKHFLSQLSGEST